MGNFKQIYAQLNTSQKKAVDIIDGPLLVIAGPGTGKTQLLSARVANILEKTDTLPQNILCLTFTEAAAQNMRERLASFIGKEAYDVTISTYHTFGSDIIRRYPEFFEDTRLERAIDDLGKREILGSIVEKLPYDNPLKSTRYHLGDLISTISELKRSLLTPESLRELATRNLHQINEISPEIAKIFEGIIRMPSKLDASRELFQQVAAILSDYQTELPHDMATLAYSDLMQAITNAETDHSTKPLTAWKNGWLHKTVDNTFAFTDTRLSYKLEALATVLEQYHSMLEKQGLYDFDDMILRSIDALQNHDDLRFNLQEKYLYILLDEFQDTNAAQFRLVDLLTDNPVHEGRPNVMAVGDDDQAIYAFQGAEVSNMVAFANNYRNTSIINLTENYRSHHDILHTAHNIAEQIENRLHHQLENVNKTLQAASTTLPAQATIERHEFNAPNQENSWVAEQVARLIASGVLPTGIAVLAPKHSYLEAIVPFLNAVQVPVSYEKRENILQTPIVIQLKSMVQLLIAIRNNDTALSNMLYPQVLSFACFEIAVPDIWQINWQRARREEQRSWAELAVDSPKLSSFIWFFQALALQLDIKTLESTLDVLIGTEPIIIGGVEQEFVSPLKDYYFSSTAKESRPLEYFEVLSHLSVIRSKLREYQASQDEQLTVVDFLDFFVKYEAAGQPLLNTHPIAQAEQSVQLMTVYKAKGLEFEHVFLLSTVDNVWGNSARGNFNKLSLPANIKYIRHAGANEDERLRLLFVALTRAKVGLYLTSYLVNESGRKSTRLKFFDEREQDSGAVEVMVLPENRRSVKQTKQQGLKTESQSIELAWHAPHVQLQPSLKSLLATRLERYQMSPTHLNTFIDMQWGGPEAFLLGTILRFPSAPTVDGEFGNAVHETLEWYQHQITKKETRPSNKDVVAYFSERLKTHYIPFSELENLTERGSRAISTYLTARGSMFKPEDMAEVNFRGEGVFVEDAHLAGNIDRMIIDKASKTITVVDFKTGASYAKWKSDLKLMKYRQQLYFYKLLIEGSHSYKDYRVEKGQLAFIEPDDNGTINTLEIEFDTEELADLKDLITAIWDRIITLDLPDSSKYDNSVKGSKEFIQFLRSRE